jgi:hypothetical protein
LNEWKFRFIDIVDNCGIYRKLFNGNGNTKIHLLKRTLKCKAENFSGIGT